MYDNLPIEIKLKILDYIIDNFYTDDKDCIYFTFEKLIRKIDGNININVFKWFGTRSPKDLTPGDFLHVIYNRPYPIKIERIFSNVSNLIDQNLEKFRLKNSFVSYDKFGGTYGPVKNEYYVKNFIPLSSGSNNYNTGNIIEYLKYLEIIEDNVDIITNDIFNSSSNILGEKINSSIINSLKDYRINNKIIGPYYKNNKLYYKLCKPISENKYILVKNLMNEYNKYV